MNTSYFYYSNKGFWRKLIKYALRMGYELCLLALTLYFALVDPNTPAWARGVIVAALGYLIMPIDAVPDMVPVVGYADDAGVLGAALATVAVHVADEHRRKAREVAEGWFGARET